jgi:AcrR family transcriptional regulator/predicted MarR family transcription regulator
MAAPTVDRADALVRRIAQLDAAPRRRDAVALGLVDAVLERDSATLTAVLDALRAAHTRADGDADLSGWLDAAIAFAHWGLERSPSPTPVAQGTQAHAFLAALAGSPRSGSADLRDLLDTDETQISRTGRRLLEMGLVMRRKVGRQVFWELTPRGRRALDDAPADQDAPNSDFWQDALRRGFNGERRATDPTRERIIESTLELHVAKGIQATTWSDIAAKSGVPEDTVTELFPTFDALTRTCGEHFMEELRLPPHDQAPDVFAGASSENERIRRMVETFFGAYERGADGITTGRRERRQVAAADESIRELDRTFEAIVAEALRPLQPDRSSVASVKALTDVEIWRGLRDHGATPQAAVDDTSAAVERWLAGATS